MKLFASPPVSVAALTLLIWCLPAVTCAQITENETRQQRTGLARLRFLLGEWETESWLYENGRKPDKPTRGWYRARMALNGLFLRDELVSGQSQSTYRGHSYHTFNPKTQRFETWYFDSDGLTVHYPGGEWRDDRTLFFSGRDTTPRGIREKHTYFTLVSRNEFHLREEQDYGDGKGFVTVLKVIHRRAPRTLAKGRTP